MALDSTCDGSLITSLYEGALSLTGVAGPIGEDTDYLLPCFGEYTPATLTSYIAEYFLDGYPPTDPNRTVAEPPHDLIVSVAVDGVCVFALMVKSLLEQGLDITELRKPSAAVYDQVLNQIRDLTFKGASGDVAFAGNDVPNYLGTWQVHVWEPSILTSKAKANTKTNNKTNTPTNKQQLAHTQHTTNKQTSPSLSQKIHPPQTPHPPILSPSPQSSETHTHTCTHAHMHTYTYTYT